MKIFSLVNNLANQDLQSHPVSIQFLLVTQIILLIKFEKRGINSEAYKEETLRKPGKES